MENISTGDGNKETLNGGGDAVQHQVERVPLGESKEGAIFNKPGSQGGLQKGDGHFLQEEEESSGGDAGAFGAAHELEAVKTSESEGQPDERLLTEGASQHTALAEEREAIDTNQVSGSQNKDSHLQAASSVDKFTKMDTGQPENLAEGASQSSTISGEESEAKGNNHSQAESGDSLTSEDESKKDRPAKTEPKEDSDNLTNGASRCTMLGEETSRETEGTKSEDSELQKGDHFVQTESGDDTSIVASSVAHTADENNTESYVDGSAEMESAEEHLTKGALQHKVLGEESEVTSAMDGTNRASESQPQKVDDHLQAESGDDSGQTALSVACGLITAKETNKPTKMESERQPNSLTISGGECEATSATEGTNQDSEQHDQIDCLHGATITVADEKDPQLGLKVQLQTELKPDRLIISLISKDLFKHTKVDVVTTALQSIESEGANVAMTNEETKETKCKKFLSLFYSFNFCLPIILAVLVCCVAWYSEREKLGTFDLEGFFLQNPETAGKWEHLDKRAIRILVTGKTGTGKSALINGLIGRNVTIEGDTLDPTTARVEQIKQMVHGISMSVFDSPGLQDGTSREQEYLQDMQQKCEKVDLVLYTIKMTDQRVHAADTKAMKKITDAFGHKFWEKAIFVMTFANEVRSPEYPDDDYENRKYFDKRLQDWIDKLPGFIEQRGDIPLNIGKHVPIVPAGYYKIRDLPGRKFWFSQFWKAALDRMMESSAEGASYMLQFSQDRLKHYNDTTEEDFEKPIHEQPILSKIIIDE